MAEFADVVTMLRERSTVNPDRRTGPEERIQMTIVALAADVIELLEKRLAVAEEKIRWTSIPDGLPEKSCWVLMMCNEPGEYRTRIGVFYNYDPYCFKEVHGNIKKDITEWVTHWMYLPDGPEEYSNV